MSFKVIDHCRACGRTDGWFSTVLHLGNQPPANGFRKPDDASPEERYPLHLVRCTTCELVQLTDVVDPATLYGPTYPYRSGLSDEWALHCHDLAREIGAGKKVLEIGCLDGVLLRECRDKGCTVQGIDPSAPESELPILRSPFTDGDQFTIGQFDVVVAQNVFGHVDDAKGFLLGIKRVLHSEGYAVIECPWVVDLIDGVKWDTVYHEHLSYWGLRPLMRLAQPLGLQVYRTEYFPDLHGGTMRYYLAHNVQEADTDLYQTWANEEMEPHDWKRFKARAEGDIAYWNDYLQLPRAMGVYGASAKLNTFLNALSKRPNLRVVLDDTPSKQGLLTPGWGFPIEVPTPEWMAQLGVLLIGAANWQDGLEKKARAMGFTGEVVSLWDMK